MRVMITRNEELAQPYQEAVSVMGGETIIQPLYHYHDVPAVLPDLSQYKALVFTSAHAVDCFCALSKHRNLPVYAVGPQTADAARAQGFGVIHQAGGTGEDLARLLSPDKGPYLYGRARDISYPLAQKAAGVDEVILYATVAVANFNWPADVDAVLFFSARAARIFAELAEKQGFAGELGRTKALCLGAGMVEFLSLLPWLDVRVAASPNRAGILELLKKERELK